jgi:hypothetical protein
MSRLRFFPCALFFLLACALPAAAQSGNGTLKVKTSSGRTGVFVDGKYLGPSANFKIRKKYTLPAGQHELILREPRYEEYKTTITITAGQTTTVNQSLQPRPVPAPPFGRLKLAGFDKYSAVYLNGSYVGFADEFDFGRQGLLIKPGEYDLEVTSQAGASVLQRKVTIQQDKTEMVRAR